MGQSTEINSSLVHGSVSKINFTKTPILPQLLRVRINAFLPDALLAHWEGITTPPKWEEKKKRKGAKSQRHCPWLSDPHTLVAVLLSLASASFQFLYPPLQSLPGGPWVAPSYGASWVLSVVLRPPWPVTVGWLASLVVVRRTLSVERTSGIPLLCRLQFSTGCPSQGPEIPVLVLPPWIWRKHTLQKCGSTLTTPARLLSAPKASASCSNFSGLLSCPSLFPLQVPSHSLHHCCFFKTALILNYCI